MNRIMIFKLVKKICLKKNKGTAEPMEKVSESVSRVTPKKHTKQNKRIERAGRAKPARIDKIATQHKQVERVKPTGAAEYVKVDASIGADSNFQGLGICSEILGTLTNLNFVTPTPIQYKSIPVAIEGKDIIGIA